jgi:hypothetical protein
VTKLRAERYGVQIPAETKHFFCSPLPYRPCGPSSFVSNEYRVLFPYGKAATNLHLIRRLRMCGATQLDALYAFVAWTGWALSLLLPCLWQNLLMCNGPWIWRQVWKLWGRVLSLSEAFRGKTYQKNSVLHYTTCRHPCAVQRAIKTDVWTRHMLRSRHETKRIIKNDNKICVIIISRLVRILWRAQL